MRKRTDQDNEVELPTNARTAELDGAGCLVGLGLLGLGPVVLVISAFAAANLRSALSTIQWTSVSGFFQSAWLWMATGSSMEEFSSLVWFFAISYCVLLWQWIVFWSGRRTLLSPSRLWAVSSAYFIAIVVIIVGKCHGTGEPLMNWLPKTLLMSTIPVIYLTITIPLWLLIPRLK